jgi:hypothetical protein
MMDEFGPRIVFAPQFGVAEAGTGWDWNEKPLEARFVTASRIPL